ncbi:hypothetical protein BC941DRAFT_518420 [Chlamydoabsidia padenii]|nr:hypothetical protein BC941DRAFT_518420 [Chlamydoabsidia padenii]
MAFYHESAWDKKQHRRRPRFRSKAYATVTRLFLKKYTTTRDTTTFYTDAGTGFGSRIKGHDKRSTATIQQNLKTKCTLVETKDYLSIFTIMLLVRFTFTTSTKDQQGSKPWCGILYQS